MDNEKTGVLLLAFGGADSVDNVESFVKNILSHKNSIGLRRPD